MQSKARAAGPIMMRSDADSFAPVPSREPFGPRRGIRLTPLSRTPRRERSHLPLRPVGSGAASLRACAGGLWAGVRPDHVGGRRDPARAPADAPRVRSRGNGARFYGPRRRLQQSCAQLGAHPASDAPRGGPVDGVLDESRRRHVLRADRDRRLSRTSSRGRPLPRCSPQARRSSSSGPCRPRRWRS
jgi:hypothetical protein